MSEFIYQQIRHFMSGYSLHDLRSYRIRYLNSNVKVITGTTGTSFD